MNRKKTSQKKMNQKKMKKAILGITTVLLVAIALPLVIGANSKKDVIFNQFMLDELGVVDRIYRLHSLYSRGIEVISSTWTGNSDAKKPEFDNVIGMFDYIYSHVPPKAYVFPSEGFYYFMTQLGELDVSGNIRIADLRKNEISFAYFTMEERKKRKTHIRTIRESDGLEVERKGEFKFRVAYKGKSVDFKMMAQPPIQENLIDGEETSVGHVFDESGVEFELVFNSTTDSFYYLLSENSQEVETEKLQDVGDGLFYAPRSAFVYYDSGDRRKVLVGVHMSHVEMNDFFDGPGDQVPYWIDIWNELRLGYPNIMKGDGVDRHGVYINRKQWQRIAVSPYVRYTAIDQLRPRIKKCVPHLGNRSLLTTCVTKEFWNDPRYRTRAIALMEREGKNTDGIRAYQLPKPANAPTIAQMMKETPLPPVPSVKPSEDRWAGIRLIKEYKRKKNAREQKKAAAKNSL